MHRTNIFNDFLLIVLKIIKVFVQRMLLPVIGEIWNIRKLNFYIYKSMRDKIKNENSHRLKNIIILIIVWDIIILDIYHVDDVNLKISIYPRELFTLLIDLIK